MTIAISGTNGITLDGQFNSASSMGFKNRILNGGMVIDQRNAGASVTPTTNTYLLDRWNFNPSAASKVSFQRSTTAPTGFINSMICTSLAATTVASGDYYPLAQGIEGFNVADLGWGTANAQTITFSFWVRTSITGTHGGAVKNLLASATRSYPFTFTVNSANTWEQKTITVSGDTSGTWATDNSCGLCLSFSLGMGSTYQGTAGTWASANYLSATSAVNVVSTNGATFYITGVQLEKGSTATSFDYRPYGTELQLCQRYYQQVGGNTGDLNSITLRSYTTSGSYVGNQYQFPVQMRTAPTMTVSGTFAVTNCGQPTALGADGSTWSFQTQASATGAMVLYSNNSGKMTFAAEL